MAKIISSLPGSTSVLLRTSQLINDGSDNTSAYVETDELGTTAFSNNYNDLNNLPIIGDGITNLDYIPSPTQGIVTSDTGSDATIPLADGTNAGLLSSVEKTRISDDLVPYENALRGVDLGEHQLKTGQLELDQTPTGAFSTAKIRWNDTAGTAEIRLKGDNVTLQLGQELVKRVVNKTATNITLQESNYQVVRIIGATGQRLSVDLAQADSEANSASTLGLVTENIANNQEGFITFSGEINLINTTGSLQGETWVDGNVLYLSPTIAGQLTNIEPIAPDRKIRVGYVQHTHATQGKIHVDVDRGYSLENLHNVKITATTAGKILGSTTEGLWENKTIAEILGYTPVNPILNINTTSPLLGGGNLTTDRTLSIQQSTGIQNGYLSSTDWNTFNSKQPALGFTSENIANKSDSYTTSSSTTYVSGKALVEGLGTKQNTLTNPVTGTGVGGQVSFWDGTNTQTGGNRLLWNNTNSSLEVNGNAPRFTLKNNLNNFSTYFTNDAYGTLFLKNHQDKTLAAFNNPVNSTEQPQMAIGKVSSIPVESQLYVYGGMNGANIDARGSIDRDEANIDLEGNDWETSPNSLGFSYFGSNSTTFGTMMGYAKNKLGVIRFQDTNYAIINSDKSTGVSPIRFGINQIEIGNVNDKGFSYQSDFSSVNSSNPRWLADKGYVDTKAPLTGTGASGTWGINITGSAATVTTNANLTGVVTSTGNVTAIANGAITNVMLANSAVANLSNTNTGDNAVNSNYSGLVSNATHTGEVTGATALTITANAVTNAKLATMATKTYKGRTSAGTGNVEDLTVAQVKSDLAINLVNNTSDANKPISTATQTALDGKQATLGFTPENVANKATDFSTVNNTLYPTIQASKNYTDFKALDNVLFENKQATRDFYKNIDNYSNSPTNTLIGVTGIGDSMSEGMPLAFTKTLSNFFPLAALMSNGFGLANALGFSNSGTLVYNGRAILTGVDFTYLPNGNHIEMTNGAVINEDTGQATAFSKLKVFFATGVGMGSALVEILNNDTEVVLDSQTLDLSGVDTGAIKAEFSLVSTIKYKVRITATNKVVYLFSAFLKSNGVIPFSLGKGGSSFAENTSSNKAILSYIASEMHISMVMLMAKEPVPSPYISDMMSMLTTYFPNSSKIIFASLPDSRTPSVVIEENRVLKEAALGSGFAWFDTYKVSKDYAELVRFGQNGDGTHPTIQPYEYANQLLFTELGFDNAVGAVIKRSINHIGTSNNVSTNILRVANGDGSGTTVDAISNAGGGTPNYILIKNVRSLALGPISGNTPGLAPFGSSVAVVTSANDALTTLRAKNLDIADATATSAINGNLTVGKLLKMTTTPTTSASGYDILTRHTTTNNIEKVPSNTFAPAVSPALTGTPTAPTATAGTNTTQLATTAFVTTAIASSGATSGTYTPTFTNIANVNSTSFTNASYTKIGNIVTVTVGFNATASVASVNTVLQVSLPISRTTSTGNNVGTGVLADNSLRASAIVQTPVDLTNVRVYYFPTTTNSHTGVISFQYSIN